MRRRDHWRWKTGVGSGSGCCLNRSGSTSGSSPRRLRRREFSRRDEDESRRKNRDDLRKKKRRREAAIVDQLCIHLFGNKLLLWLRGTNGFRRASRAAFLLCREKHKADHQNGEKKQKRVDRFLRSGCVWVSFGRHGGELRIADFELRNS